MSSGLLYVYKNNLRTNKINLLQIIILSYIGHSLLKKFQSINPSILPKINYMSIHYQVKHSYHENNVNKILMQHINIHIWYQSPYYDCTVDEI